MRVTQVVRVTQTVTPNLLHASMVATPHGKAHSIRWTSRKTTFCRWISRKDAVCVTAAYRVRFLVTPQPQTALFREPARHLPR